MADGQRELTRSVDTEQRQVRPVKAELHVSGSRAQAAIAVTALVVAAVAAYLATPLVPDSLTLLFFLAAVTLAAIVSTFPIALASAIGGTLVYTFLAGRIPEHPYFAHFLTGSIAFGGAGIAISIFGRRLRAHIDEAERRATDMAGLYHFSRQLVGATELSDIANIAIETSERLLGCSAVLLVKADHLDSHSLTLFPTDLALSEREREAAAAAMRNTETDGGGRDDYADVDYLFMPLKSGDESLGVIGFLPGNEDDARTFRERLAAYRLTGAFVDLTSLTIAQRLLKRAVNETTEEAELHSRRSDALISLAHDLNSPLAVIVGASSSLLQYDSYFDRITRQDMVATINEEAQRLTRFVRNLLQLTKFENQGMEPRRLWIDVSDLVASAVSRMKRLVKDRTLSTSVAREMPLIRADFVLMEQALTNLLENAVKYSEPDAPIWIEADRREDDLLICVHDRGIGLSPDDRERIFDRMYRARKRDHIATGSGLGLTIARAIVEAHGGTLQAQSHGLGHGSTFTITLPIPAQPTRSEEGETSP